MKRINGLILSAITAAFLVGCGGGSSSSTGGSTGTDITVERGPVYNATVTDANGQVATQKSGTNIYTFATTPVYPITATGGIIDIDGNGIDEGDVELTTVLTSYSTVITPITTYLGDVTTDTGKAKLAKLKEISGVTDDNDLLKKVPSALSSDVIVLTNALFDIMNDGDSSNDDFVSDYDNSQFKTKISEYKTEADKYADKLELVKALEEKAVTNLGLTKITSTEATSAQNGTTTSTTLKVADLKRFVSYKGGDDWYDDNTVADGKVTFKSYKDTWNSTTNKVQWILQEETNPYVNITLDATNPYKLTYSDPDTKEEGTFKIISTKPVDGYTDLYVSKVETKVTKRAVENFDTWTSDYPNPYYYDNTTQQKIDIVDVNTLRDAYLKNSWYFYFDNNAFYTLNSDGTISSIKSAYSASNWSIIKTLVSGSWKIDGNQIVVSVGTKTKYIQVIKKDDGKYYTSDYTISEVGDVEYDTIYTGSNLDDLITKINAPAPTFTSEGIFSVDENQTSAFTAKATSGAKIIYSLENGSDSYFNIDSSTGVVTFKTAPDYEKQTFYYAYVKATNKLNQLSLTQNVMVFIKDVAESSSTTPSTTSIISGKQLVLNDGQSNVTLNFNSNGTYSESGFDTDTNSDYTCSGLWLDLGNSKIAATCENGGTSKVPTESDTTFQFTTLENGTTVTVKGDVDTTPFDATIVSSSNL